ncbi:MAG: hypothetical protein A2033_08370 [Bacteroidetes bacterium GWA2_31_9]|nr:MAG: hypothetical protein A2033_08370 [Bacteroidetes bacterium GWA2_31_9]
MEKIEVVYKEKARLSIQSIAMYIEENGYPETSEKFAIKLFEFGDSLENFPNKYPLCKRKSLKRQNLKCATFKKNYIFVYKLIETELVIYNVIHSKRLK